MPSPRTASVRTIGGFQPSLGPSESTCRTSFSIVFASGWSILLIAITSGISMIPAFSAWIESPEPGISASTTVSAIERTPTSLWPVPTVSRKTTSLPGGVEHEQRLQRRLGEPAEVAARAHRADEDVGVEEVVGEADAVAEQRAVRERARRVDGDDADLLVALRARGGRAPRRGSTCRRPAGR